MSILVPFQVRFRSILYPMNSVIFLLKPRPLCIELLSLNKQKLWALSIFDHRAKSEFFMPIIKKYDEEKESWPMDGQIDFTWRLFAFLMKI